MKRFLSLLFCALICVTIIPCHISAEESNPDDQIIIAQTVEDVGNGFYYIETISVPAAQTYGNTRTGTKTAQCVYSGATIFTIAVTGTFTYDGTTADATSATYSFTIFSEDATAKSRNAYTSGSSAIASASVYYKGFTLQKTVTLTCDKNGNLS